MGRRKLSDPLVWSNMLLTLVGYIYLVKGWILQAVLIILASVASYSYHRNSENKTILIFDKSASIAALLVTLPILIWYCDKTTKIIVVICTIIAFQQFFQAGHYDTCDHRYDIPHLGWHLGVTIGQAIVAINCTGKIKNK